jgi:hypothetical protein
MSAAHFKLREQFDALQLYVHETGTEKSDAHGYKLRA